MQFNHRLWAYGLLIAGVALVAAAWRGVHGPHTLAIAGLLLVQVGLGVATLAFTVPLPLAMVHQFTAAVILALATALVWRARRN